MGCGFKHVGPGAISWRVVAAGADVGGSFRADSTDVTGASHLTRVSGGLRVKRLWLQ